MLFVLYGLGFTFFLCKFPENMYPNRFWSTILIPSHTLWHVFVLLAVLNWHWHLLKAK
jgi:predicted membrane channel-forming protein YqfA (hemolysin III family)